LDNLERCPSDSNNDSRESAGKFRHPSTSTYFLPNESESGVFGEKLADFRLCSESDRDIRRFDALIADALRDGSTQTPPRHFPTISTIHKNFASIVRNQAHSMAHFPEMYHEDIAFLLTHPSGRNLASHSCMGVSHTHAHRTAVHDRGLHIRFSIEIAVEMAERLKLPAAEALDCVIAVAVHDQGHIFASHQSETAINSFVEFRGESSSPKFCHEHRTRELLDSDEFVRHFGQERIERMKSILYDASNPMHLFVDWADRLAYLIADSIYLGHVELIKASSVRPQFIESLTRLSDGSIGFSTLDPVSTLICARDTLYKTVSEGPASTLFKAFLTEAYHRAVEWQKMKPAEFVGIISNLSTPEARKLFHPEDQQRLYCPERSPDCARPVDQDYIPVSHVTLDMLSPRGRQVALSGECVPTDESTPGCLKPRAGLSKFESVIRGHFAAFGGEGYLERIKGLVGVAHMPRKQYHLKHVIDAGAVQHVTVEGQEHWEMFVAIPAESQSIAPILNREIVHALTEAGFIDQTKNSSGEMPNMTRLATVPSPSLFVPVT
jgi:hypothetical protein